jgi:taurine dioxygenase
MSEADSDALKAELFEHAFKPELQFAYRWQAGDVLLWDNRCVMHSATAGYTQNRTMYRTTVRGSVPYFDAAAVTTPIIPQPM